MFESIREKKETDLLDTVIDVVTLMLGGIIGGKAFQVVTAGYSWFYELLIYAGLLLIGVSCVYLIRLSKPIGDAVSEHFDQSE